MDTILDRIRAARSADQVAQELEPLCQALALIADDFRDSTLKASEQAQAQARSWDQAQTSAAGEWLAAQEKTTKAWTDAAKTLKASAQEARAVVAELREDRASEWRRTITTGLIAGLIGAALSIGFVLWRPPVQVLSPQVNIDPARLVELMKEAGWQDGTRPARK
jgi:multidrug efflux pump subunit AcrA (membrane-fusion protein)